MSDRAAPGRKGIEPLVRMADLAEYRQGLARRQAGAWDDERWTAFRVRFGIYGQRQPGVQMVRIKIPGGVVPVPWLKTLAQVNRAYATGDAHITTRQDFQIYSVDLARTPDLLEELFEGGITTREACGNTVRNINACALSGICPRERVDAGRVAEQLARSWIRHPLVQHMPRKIKISVSGCAADCAGGAIHDLGLVATSAGGRNGFAVLAGGGLGPQPVAACHALDFVAEEDLPALLEATARLHQRYSDRRNRNAARLKFVHKRFGPEKFTALLAEEFGRVRELSQRPWQPLAWRQGGEALVPRAPAGVFDAHDGSQGVVASVPLGILSTLQLEGLHALAIEAGISQLRTTRDQNIVFVGVRQTRIAPLVAGIKALGLGVPADPSEIQAVVSCPGTTTCRIGITNSQGFATHLLAETANDSAARSISVNVSGCQNSCGLHHVADIGLHGTAKKLDGRSAPHYQIHLGGDVMDKRIALAGPVVPARLADEAVRLLRNAILDTRENNETVHAWAARQGKAGLAAILAPIEGKDADGLFVDWGDEADFAGPPQAKGECAAPFAIDGLLDDYADDALINVDRFIEAGRWPEALNAAEQASVFAARRLLVLRQADCGDDQPAEEVYAALRSLWAREQEVVDALDSMLAERIGALGTGQIAPYREAVAYLIDTVRDLVEAGPAPVTAAVGNIASLLAGAEV